MKYRVKFTAEDYYDYIGSNPYCSLKKRVKECIPDEFLKGMYNLKFKKISRAKTFRGHTYYRIQISVNNMKESEIAQVFERRKTWCYSYSNINYKPINKTIKK